MKVNFYATLRQVVGARAVEIALPEDATIQQLLDEVIRLYPGLQHELLDDQGQLYRHVHLFVNGRDATFLEQGMQTRVCPDDSVGIFPAVGGG